MLEALDLPLILSISAVLGAIFGSVANMLIHRLPLQQEVVVAPSHCPQCKAVLRWYELIPICSYLWQRGVCRHCNQKIASRYFWVELACALLFGVIAMLHGATALSVILCMVAFTLIVLIAIDLKHMIIPDVLQVMLAILGVLYVWVVERPITDALWMAAAGFLFALSLRGLMFLWKKQEGLGWGDVKFFAVAGLYLPWQMVAPFLFLAGIIGIATAFIAGRTQEGHFPFGPALAIALLVCLLYPF